MYRVKLVALAIVFVLVCPAAAQDDAGPVSIVFMHHSTGYGVMTEGRVREGLTALGYEFWDHDYNDPGLTGPDGDYTGVSWDVPGDNTDPDGWYNIFNQPVTDPPNNTFSHMLRHDVIIFKSCFPASNIGDDETFRQYQEYYLGIRDVIDQHPDKLFIPWTTPPLVPNSTDAEEATRARRWAEYLTSDEYIGGRSNIAVFDIFNLLADEDGYLRAEYRPDEWDSHPNTAGNQAAGAVMIEFVDQAIQAFQAGEGFSIGGPFTGIVSGLQPPGSEEDEPAEPGEAPADAAGLVDDFEGDDFDARWWSYFEGGGTVTCAGAGEGGNALHMAVEFSGDGYVACGAGGLDASNWIGAAGLTFGWQSNVPGVPIYVTLSTETAVAQAELQTPGEAWEQVSLALGDFEGGEIDPAAVIGLSFDMEGSAGDTGTIVIDDIWMVFGEHAAAEPAGQGEPPAQAEGGTMIDDFESGTYDDVWWAWHDDGVLECASVEPGYDYAHSMQMTFDLGAGRYGGCGRDVESAGWANTQGISFVWRSDTPGLPFTVLAEAGAPYIVELETPGEEWVTVTLDWSDFTLAEWGDSAAPASVDPVNINSIDFGTGHWEIPVNGTVWIDAVQVIAGEVGARPVNVVGISQLGSAAFDKFALWTNGTQLRGANIWLRVVAPELDGDFF